MGSSGAGRPLDGVTTVLAVVAHPDDESFGLGAILDAITRAGGRAAVICFTRGEASTLGTSTGTGTDPDTGTAAAAGAPAADLGTVRAGEMRQAARALGIERVELLDYPDGGLDRVPLAELAGHVTGMITSVRPSHLLAFDAGGVTGHPDHVQATRAAVAAAAGAGLPVLGWAVPAAVATALNTEFGTAFVGRDAGELALATRITVSRRRQGRAIACHRSQASDNPVLRRRIALMGDTEYLYRLR